MNVIQERVQRVRNRQQWQWTWNCFSWGLVVGGIVGCLAGILRLALSGALEWTWIAGAVLTGPMLGAMWAMVRPRQLFAAAKSIDEQSGLKDRAATALLFLNRPGTVTPIQELQVADAASHLLRVDPKAIAPFRSPRPWPMGLIFNTFAVLLIFASNPQSQVVAAPVVNEVVAAQADRLEVGLKELEKLRESQENPELEQLLKEMMTKIEELKAPGIEPKEALAKMSEMEAALLDMQQQLADPGTDAKLQQVGEALSLAEPMAAAGQAMSEGNLEKAAEELEKLDLPVLDRKTEKTVLEKLEQTAKNTGEGAQRKLQEAIGQLAQGISQGDRGKFREGVEGLAGQCRSSSKKKKLSDLLRKQCQCLGECKSECESECQNPSNAKGKGGSKWGTGASGNELGDKTPSLKTGPQMNITGQESESGEVDVETIKSDEQQQQAARQYREKVDKYQQLSESVLENEAIPLGHRQTIRRYFEMIRPQNGEVDQVNKATDK
jgi:hypothetical protein